MLTATVMVAAIGILMMTVMLVVIQSRGKNAEVDEMKKNIKKSN